MDMVAGHKNEASTKMLKTCILSEDQKMTIAMVAKVE